MALGDGVAKDPRRALACVSEAMSWRKGAAPRLRMPVAI